MKEEGTCSTSPVSKVMAFGNNDPDHTEKTNGACCVNDLGTGRGQGQSKQGDEVTGNPNRDNEIQKMKGKDTCLVGNAGSDSNYPDHTSANRASSDADLERCQFQGQSIDDKVNINTNSEIRDTEFLSCLVCATSFSRKPDLMKHLTKIHRLTNLCTLCYFQRSEIQRSTNPVSLRNHKLRAHPEDMVHCVCGTLFIDEKMLMFHLKKFKCDKRLEDCADTDMTRCVCGKRFVSEDMLLSHQMLKCRRRTSGEMEKEQFKSVNPHLVMDGGGYRQVTHGNGKPRHCATISYADMYPVDDGNVPKGQLCVAGDLTNTEDVCNGNYRNIRNASAKKTVDNDPNNNDIAVDNSSTMADVNMNTFKEEPHHKTLDKETKPGRYGSTTKARKYEALKCHGSVLTNSSTKPEKFGHHLLQTSKRMDVKCKQRLVSSNRNLSSADKDNAHDDHSKTERDYCLSQTTSKYSSSETDEETDAHGHFSRTSVSSRDNSLFQTTPTKIKRTIKDICQTDPTDKKGMEGKEMKVNVPDTEGRYPCKVCEKPFKRPYLYVHQKQVHGKKRRFVAQDHPVGKSYKCGWCSFTTVNWNSIITHHYKRHPSMELDVLSVPGGPKSAKAIP